MGMNSVVRIAHWQQADVAAPLRRILTVEHSFRTLRVGIFATAAVVVLTACKVVSVEVPPEINLQAAGIRTVAVVADDLPADPAPVGVLLRAETTWQMRRLLPSLVIVADPEHADAVLRMEVASHNVGTPYFQTAADAQGRLTCDAWQETVLIVDTTIFQRGHASADWQALLEKRSRITLACVPRRGPSWVSETPAPSDPELVSAVVTELGNRLAGYTRKELHR